jgi:hypothetical protein
MLTVRRNRVSSRNLIDDAGGAHACLQKMKDRGPRGLESERLEPELLPCSLASPLRYTFLKIITCRRWLLSTSKVSLHQIT